MAPIKDLLTWLQQESHKNGNQMFNKRDENIKETSLQKYSHQPKKGKMAPTRDTVGSIERKE